MTEITKSFTPDWVSPPGDTIADLLEEKDWTQAQFAERIGFTPKFISHLINGKAPITEETALKLERVLGGSTKFWLTREAQYRAHLSRLSEETPLQSWVPWLDEFPVRELMKQGLLSECRVDSKNKPGLVRELLRFFGVASPDDWRSVYAGMEVSFRRTRSEQSNVGAIATWIRLGEIQSESIDCPKFNKSRFTKAVNEIRSLTVLEPREFEPKLKKLCWESGVVLALVPALKGAHVSGLARWLNPHKALIQLSLYGKTNDRFWFTFFHEAVHILLHDKQDIFLDEWDGGNDISSAQEHQANQWAGEFLIPPKYNAALRQLKSKEAVLNFANKLGIHPGIVVGRLQHEQIIQLNWMNDLKQKVCFQQ
jgi:HTH-type transcriptional regulator / antitoxin HigA